MQKFDHFLITRFNLKSREWTKDKNKEVILTDDWLQHRFGLFDAYCMPSVTGQTNKNFTWLIYLSDDTKEEFQKKISGMVAAFPWIVITYLRDQEQFAAGYLADIQRLRNPENDFVITTRIDNDDVIHPQMIERIQDHFQSQVFMAINFTFIYCLRIEGPSALFKDISFSNHFISLIEEVSDLSPIGCYAKRDREWNVEGRIIQVFDGVFCMELIHARNMANEIKGFPVWRSEALKEFNLQQVARPRLQLSDFFFWRMPWIKLFKLIAKKF